MKCSVDGCERAKMAKGFCQFHWRHIKLYGDPHVTRKRGQRDWPSISERFWQKVVKTDGCWEWTGSVLNSGYGDFNRAARRIRPHRFSWEQVNGPVPDGLFVCHRCDNPICVRPDHLFLGTLVDNVADMKSKRRQAFGARQWSAKLTDEAVIAIRAADETLDVLAKQYGVSAQTIHRVKHHKSWTHVL